MKQTTLILMILVILIINLNCGTALSQKKQTQRNQDKPQKNNQSLEIENLINDARSLPAEFSVDLLLQIANSSKIIDKHQKQAILEDAFYRASSAQNKLKLRSLPGTIIDTRSGYLARAYEFNLDELALKSRVIKSLLSIDPQKAKELFDQLPQIDLPPLTCETLLVYDVDDFYFLVGEIAHQAYSPEETRREEHIFFLQSKISNISSPVQIEPMAKIILTFSNDPNHFAVLMQSFIKALTKLPDDNRSLGAVSFRVINSIGQLVARCDDLSISNNDLLETLRNYLTNQFNKSHCTDCLNKNDITSYINDFNKILSSEKLSDQRKVAPIAEEEIKSAKTENTAKAYPFWQSVEARNLLIKIKHLRFGSGSKMLSTEERTSLAWQKELDDFLRSLDTWQAQREKSDGDYFHQKCDLYRGLLNLTSDGIMRDKVISDYIVFLRESSMQQDKRIEWFLHAKPLIDLIGTSQGKEAAQLRETLSNNAGSVIRLYAEMKKLEGKQVNP